MGLPPSCWWEDCNFARSRFRTHGNLLLKECLALRSLATNWINSDWQPIVLTQACFHLLALTMSPDGSNCGMLVREKDLEDVSCPCGQGYINNEGTFVPGQMIRHGHALHREDYEDHVDCEVCTRDPADCDWRRKRLERPTSRKLLASPPSGFFQFFVPDMAIHEAVLREFLSVNVGQRAAYLTEKRFKVSD